MNTCLKRAHFFAQAFVESSTDLSGAFNGESLNYSVEALRSGYPFSVFQKNKQYYDYADKIGRKSEIDPKTKKKRGVHSANQEEIANIAFVSSSEVCPLWIKVKSKDRAFSAILLFLR